MNCITLWSLLALLFYSVVTAFVAPSTRSFRHSGQAVLTPQVPTGAASRHTSTLLFAADDDISIMEEATPATKKLSLEEKMKTWEATEEEVKEASLGGVVPERTDAFDVGLWILFPLMVGTGLLFAIFPLIMGNIDVTEFGPPPTS